MRNTATYNSGRTGNRPSLLTISFTFLTILILASSAHAAVQVLGITDCNNLVAGQNIDAGEVCAEVVGDNLVVTYNTVGGWELTEAHLFAGLNLADMPMTKRGNPKIGNFLYNSGDISGATTYSFYVPLASLGTEEVLCGSELFLAAHAALRLPDGNGGFQTETGWGSGAQIVDGGSWAMYYSINFECETAPPPPVLNCETAFAFGDKKLLDILDINSDPITNRWGWEITMNAGSMTKPIYAGAGQNDITKGTHVGDLLISYNGSSVTVEFMMFSGFIMNETHLYAGTTDTQTAAPGQFGNLHDLSAADYDSYTISISGDPIYIVAHAVVCSEQF